MRTWTWLAVTSACILGGGLMACSDTPEDEECFHLDGATIRFVGGSAEVWRAGHWRIDVSSNAGSWSCEADLPGENGNECAKDVLLFSFADGEGQVRINDPATSYHITVMRDDATVVDGDITPTWENVSGCGMSDGHEGSGTLPVLPSGA